MAGHIHPSLSTQADEITVDITDGPLGSKEPRRINAAGAVVLFEGLVRPGENGKTITGITYEIYEPMAKQMLRKLAHQAMTDFKLMHVAVEHSHGFVPTFQCSFRLQVASAHRAEGLAGMDWFIQRMKEDVPIWKHPRFLREIDHSQESTS